MQKKVLITGAGGFIGLNAVKMFNEHGWKVFAVVHNRVPEDLKNIEKIKADVTDEVSVQKLWDNLPTKPDVIVHIAGLASDIGSDSLFKKINYDSVRFLASLPVEKFIYISSSDVYGIKDFHGETEDELGFCEYPKNPYPHYKIESEKWLSQNCKTKYVILRPAAVWGENDKTLESRVVDFLKTSPAIIHFGKWRGKNRWPLANVHTVAKTLLAVAQTDDYNGQAITVIDSDKTSIDDFYRGIAKKYFPYKKFKTVCLPLWLGKIIGFVSTTLSNMLRKKQPLFDPSAYALHHVSSNLDFSSEKMEKILSDSGL